MKKVLLIFVIYFLVVESYGQEKKRIYVDDSFNVISKKEFDKKIYSDMFLTVRIENDTAIIEKLRFKNYFGDLGKKKKAQLNKLFHKRFQIDSTKSWLIYYQDTLSNVKVSQNRNERYLKRSKKMRKYLIIDDFRNYAEFDPDEYEKLKNTSILFFYEVNNRTSVGKDKIKWHKDYNSILKRTFFDGLRSYKYIIIHPNGDFHLSSFVKTFSKNKDLLKLKSFKELKKNWVDLLEKYN